MSWELLPTDYTDAVWSGLKKYTQIDNEDGTVSFRDDTTYTNKEKSFFGAKDANQINNAINTLMTMAGITVVVEPNDGYLIPMYDGNEIYALTLATLIKKLKESVHLSNITCGTGDPPIGGQDDDIYIKIVE